MNDWSGKDRGPGSQGNHQGQGQGQGYGYGYNSCPPQHPYLQHGTAYNYSPGTQPQPAAGPAYGYSRPYDAPIPGYESHNQTGYGNSASSPNSHGHQLQSYGSSGPHYQNAYSPALHGSSGPMSGPYANTSAAATPMNQSNPVNRPGPQTLLFRKSPSADKVIFVHPAGVPVTSPPLYCLSSSPDAEYVLARGSDPNNSTALVGQVKSHTFSSKYDMTVRGRTCALKGSTLGTTYKIDIPGRGSYKWHTDDFSSKMWLKDENKSVLATYDKSKEKRTWKKFLGGRDRQLTIHGSFDEFFVEVILLSVHAVKLAEEAADETVEEILDAVSGAAGA
ncbi:hypothetical protein BDW67DRAFT_164472 [Aspergillus spinulosporus]